MARRWTDPAVRERAVRELSATLTPPGRYPSNSEFASAGLSGLYTSIRRTPGGHDAYAAQLGLHRHLNADWSDPELRARKVAQLAATVSPPGRYPYRREFMAAGIGGLVQCISAQPGGHRRLAAELGLHRQGDWSDPDERARAVRELAATAEPPGRYPSHSEFRAAGLAGLHHHIERDTDGHDALAAHLGLQRLRPGYRPTRRRAG